MAGSGAWSQYARSTNVRQLLGGVVSQMWVIVPGPSIVAIEKLAPESMLTDGEIFHPTPRSRAALAPVP